MTDTHYELMSTLQSQRDQLARFIWIFAPPEYATLRTMAVDTLDLTQQIIQTQMQVYHLMHLKRRIARNTYVIERLNAALVAMPQAAYEVVEGGLSEVKR